MNPQEVEIVLTVEQYKNLMTFLNRVDVKGVNEAAALVDLAKRLGTPRQKKETEVAK